MSMQRSQVGQRNDVLFKEVSAFQRCPLVEVRCITITITIACDT